MSEALRDKRPISSQNTVSQNAPVLTLTMTHLGFSRYCDAYYHMQYIHTHTHMYIYNITYIRMHTHTYTHTHIQTYRHTYMYSVLYMYSHIILNKMYEDIVI